MSFAMSNLSLLDSLVRNAERLCESEHRLKVNLLYLLYEIYERADHPMNENLHHFIATRNIRALSALCDLVLVIMCYRNNQISRSILPVAERL